MIFDRAWEIAKMGYAGMPLDETSVYYNTIRRRLGLGEPFDTGEQRRVFNIPGEPNFVAKVVNSEGKEDPNSPYEFDEGYTDSGMWEDYVYPSLARVIPKTAERYLVPGEAMGVDQNISSVVRQPRVNVHPPYGESYRDFYEEKGKYFERNFLASALEELRDHPERKEIIDEIEGFLEEQDTGYPNFSDDMKLLDYYYWPTNAGRVFKE